MVGVCLLVELLDSQMLGSQTMEPWGLVDTPRALPSMFDEILQCDAEENVPDS